ncbi:flagellar biosynthetic protein FliR [Thalassotalea sp. PLHSN55]|uniref:flagellar biosynthetic protein FliR n=1 Tax=Thalassotalea sp. PLHSN55 TaxID=3435888 RepID=UPI003F85FE4E
MTISTPELMMIMGKLWWPFIRIAAVLWLMPFFGDPRITPTVRILFALIIAIIIAPIMPAMPAVDPFSLASVTLAVEQIVFGVVLGLSLNMLFTVMIMVGQFVSMQMGLSMAIMNDPANGGSAPIISQIMMIFATLLFLALNGHLIAIDIIIESFRTWPVGSSVFQLDLHKAIMLYGWMFGAALMLSMPAIIAMLLVNITFGVMNRSAPSLNVFSLGFPMGMMMGLICLSLVFSAIPSRFLDFTVYVLAQMRAIIGG